MSDNTKSENKDQFAGSINEIISSVKIFFPALDSSSDGIRLIDHELNELISNTFAQKIIQPADDSSNNKCACKEIMADISKNGCIVERALKSGQKTQGTVLIGDENTAQWKFDVTATPIVDTNQKSISVVELLKRSIKRDRFNELITSDAFINLINQFPEAITIINAKGEILCINSEFTKKFQHDSKDIIGSNINRIKFFKDNTTKKFINNYLSSEETDSPSELVDSTCVRKDGTLVKGSIYSGLLSDEKKVTGRILIFRDFDYPEKTEKNLS